MKFYVYILVGKNSRYYIGTSNNVARRFKGHNKGLSRSTAPHKPFQLVRVEGFNTIKEAYTREVFLKSKKSRKILEKIVKSSPDVLAEQDVGIPISQSEHRDSVGRAALS